MSHIARLSLALASVALFPCARAQTGLPSNRVQPIAGTVRDAGTFHLVTNSWTRKASSASLGADTIYDNTCTGSYNGTLSGDTYVDEGRIPSPSGPTNINARPGCATSYRIDGFQIGYCTDQPAPLAFELGFFESYAACATVIGVTPSGSTLVDGLPGGATGAVACWTVTVDLGAPPGGTALSFAMAADGDGTYTGTTISNLFGWSFRSTLPASQQAGTGPMIRGNFLVCSGYDGTRWDPVVNYAEQGTGMSTLDQFRIEGVPTVAGCYYFGGNPFASFHLEL